MEFKNLLILMQKVYFKPLKKTFLKIFYHYF
jgi:hypothetical protein